MLILSSIFLQIIAYTTSMTATISIPRKIGFFSATALAKASTVYRVMGML